MTIEAVEERFGGILKTVQDLDQRIEDGQQIPYVDTDNPEIRGKPTGTKMHLEFAEAISPHLVEYTVYDSDSFNGINKTDRKILSREAINRANLNDGNWRRRTSWLWRP